MKLELGTVITKETRGSPPNSPHCSYHWHPSIICVCSHNDWARAVECLSARYGQGIEKRTMSTRSTKARLLCLEARQLVQIFSELSSESKSSSDLSILTYRMRIFDSSHQRQETMSLPSVYPIAYPTEYALISAVAHLHVVESRRGQWLMRLRYASESVCSKS